MKTWLRASQIMVDTPKTPCTHNESDAAMQTVMHCTETAVTILVVATSGHRMIIMAAVHCYSGVLVIVSLRRLSFTAL